MLVALGRNEMLLPGRSKSGIATAGIMLRAPDVVGECEPSPLALPLLLPSLEHGAFAPFVRPTPQNDPWRHDRGRIVSSAETAATRTRDG
jgi:hypothetical protein